MRATLKGLEVRGDREDLQWDPGEYPPQVSTASPVHMLTVCDLTQTAVGGVTDRHRRLPLN